MYIYIYIYTHRHSTCPWCFLIIIKPCLHKVLVKNYHLTLLKFLISKPSSSHGHKLDGDEIVNAPLSCYIVKWRNRKVAITGLVQL